MNIWVGMLFASIVMLTSIVEGVIGFGGNILALPLVGCFVSLKTAVPVLMIAIVGNAIFRVIKDYRLINVREYLIMVGLSCVGIPIGHLMLNMLDEIILKLFLGGVMLVVGGKGLWVLSHKQENQGVAEEPSWKKMIYLIFPFIAGIIQGAFACGGPFLVIYATVVLKEKDHFRLTLFAASMTTALAITLQNLASGVFSGDVLYLTYWTLPALLLAYLISNPLQKKINGDAFTKFVHVVLFSGGVLTLSQSVWRLLG